MIPHDGWWARRDLNPHGFRRKIRTLKPSLGETPIGALDDADIEVGAKAREVLRLGWDQVDLETGVIRLTGEETKTRTMRNVEITDNLRAWRAKYCGAGRVTAYRRWATLSAPQLDARRQRQCVNGRADMGQIHARVAAEPFGRIVADRQDRLGEDDANAVD